MNNYYRRPGGIGGILSLAIGVLILIGLFLAAKSLFFLLMRVSPFLLIATLFIRFQVVANFFKQLTGLFKRSPWLGVGGVVLTALVYPVIIFYLFIKALSPKKKIDQQQPPPFFFGPPKKEKQKQSFDDYEEIEEIEPDDLDIPEPLIRDDPEQSDYDELFK